MRRAWLATMPGSEIPVIRQPYDVDDQLPFWGAGRAQQEAHFLFDLDVDPDEQENRATRGESAEAEMLDLLQTALREIDAPDEQFARLGLT